MDITGRLRRRKSQRARRRRETLLNTAAGGSLGASTLMLGAMSSGRNPIKAAQVGAVLGTGGAYYLSRKGGKERSFSAAEFKLPWQRKKPSRKQATLTWARENPLEAAAVVIGGAAALKYGAKGLRYGLRTNARTQVITQGMTRSQIIRRKVDRTLTSIGRHARKDARYLRHRLSYLTTGRPPRPRI